MLEALTEFFKVPSLHGANVECTNWRTRANDMSGRSCIINDLALHTLRASSAVTGCIFNDPETITSTAGLRSCVGYCSAYIQSLRATDSFMTATNQWSKAPTCAVWDM